MKGIIKKAIKKISSRFVENTEPSSVQDKDLIARNFYSVLKKIKFDPIHIVDIGANHGSWTREALQYFPNAYYTLVEPQIELREYIKDVLDSNPKVSFNNYGAYSHTGVLKFSIASRDDSSSFALSEEEAKLNGIKQIEIPVITLNELIGKSNLPVPGIIKIDAEGVDLEVLKGASDFFGKTEVIMVEAAVVCNSIENSILKVLNFMNDNGYTLFEITDLNRTTELRLLWLTELVFVKKGGIINSQNFEY